MLSFNATKSLDSTKLYFLVDDDDAMREDYPGTVIVGAPTGDPTGPLNREALATAATIVGFIGDDSRCATKGWDVMVEEALREPGFAWGCDETGPAAWPSTAFCSTDIVRRVGYFALPALRRGFFDVQWVTVARAAGLERVIRASFPHDNHDHPVAPEIIAADERAFGEWQRTKAADDVAKARIAYDLAHFFPRDLIGV